MAQQYIYDYIDAVIDNRDMWAIEYGLLAEAMTIYTDESYSSAIDYLATKLKFEDVEFNSMILQEVFPSPGFNSSWNYSEALFKIFDLEYEDEKIYKNAKILMQYAEMIGLPDDWEEKLEVATYLDDFKNNYSKIDTDDYKLYDDEKVQDIIENKAYDVFDAAQVKVLASLVYYMFDDSNGLDRHYSRLRLLNQLAINADFNDEVLEAIEDSTSGWYADDLERNLDKVDALDMKHNMKREKLQNRLTEEDLKELETKYGFLLDFEFTKGFVGLEDQRNDKLIIKMGDKVVYETSDYSNDFGDTSIDKREVLAAIKKIPELKDVEDFILG